MRPKRAFDLQAVDDLRSGPALGRSEDDHGPARPRRILAFSSALLNRPDLADGLFDRRRHQPVHFFRIFALDEKGRPAAAAKELFQFLVLDAREDRRIADLESVQVQDRQNRSIRDRIEKLVGLPGGRQGTGLGLAVADDAGDNESWIVERGAEGVAERISKLTALVNRTRRRRRHMARNASWKGELFEKPHHPGFVLADVWIDLAIAALEIGVSDQSRSTMTWTGDVDHVELVEPDRPVQMDVNEVLPWRRSPMPDHQRFDMGQRERLAQQRIRVEIDLADREVVRGAPVGVEQLQFARIRNPLSFFGGVAGDRHVSW